MLLEFDSPIPEQGKEMTNLWGTGKRHSIFRSAWQSLQLDLS